MKKLLVIIKIIVFNTLFIYTCNPIPDEKIGEGPTTVIAEFAFKKEVPDTLGDASLRKEIQAMYSMDTIPPYQWLYGINVCNSDGQQFETYKLKKMQDGNEEYYRIEEK